MKPLIIYTSYSGTTHRIAEQVREACGGDLIEVKSWDIMSRLFMYMARRSPDIKIRDDGVPPSAIDLSGYDLVVIGTPVWMGKPTPCIRKTIAGLFGCSGKPVVIFATCGEKPGTTLEILAADLAAKGMTIAGQYSMNTEEIREGTVLKTLIAKVTNSGSGP